MVSEKICYILTIEFLEITFKIIASSFRNQWVQRFIFDSQITTEAQGKPWSEETSSARNYVAFTPTARLQSDSSSSATNGFSSYSGGGSNYSGGGGGGYQDSYQQNFGMSKCVMYCTSQECRDHFVYVPSQWETLHCNVIPHWLSAYPNWWVNARKTELQCVNSKKDVTPLLTHWSSVFLALTVVTHRNDSWEWWVFSCCCCAWLTPVVTLCISLVMQLSRASAAMVLSLLT